MWLFFCYLISQVNGIVMPKIGNKYATTINIPLVGSQFITTEVLSKRRVNILLEGKINLQGQAIVYQKNNENYFILNKDLADYFEKKKINFKFENYDSFLDEIKFKINIKPLFYTRKVTLKNINNL
jgi:hypothetical protein